MKKLNQPLLLAAMLLMAGSAYAQAPTNTYQGPAFRTFANPGAAPTAPGDVNTAGPTSNNQKGTYSKTYSDYSQDSYVSQTGSNNYATVDQVNTSGGTRLGNTAILDQTGNNNNASQSQSASGAAQGVSNYYTGSTRNFMRATQNGNSSQTQQTQASGVANNMAILQGEGTTGNRAIQRQGTDAGGASVISQAQINQKRFNAVGGGSNNYAEQVQTGLEQSAKIDQEASSSYAKQTQSGGADVAAGTNANDAYIHQGDPGTRNSAEQSQNGVGNKARIQQSVMSNGNDNYAMQTQNGRNNQADIDQRSSGNYAEQMQSNNNNYSSMVQSNVRSAAYSVQSGAANTAIITQH